MANITAKVLSLALIGSILIQACICDSTTDDTTPSQTTSQPGNPQTPQPGNPQTPQPGNPQTPQPGNLQTPQPPNPSTGTTPSPSFQALNNIINKYKDVCPNTCQVPNMDGAQSNVTAACEIESDYLKCFKTNNCTNSTQLDDDIKKRENCKDKKLQDAHNDVSVLETQLSTLPCATSTCSPPQNIANNNNNELCKVYKYARCAEKSCKGKDTAFDTTVEDVKKRYSFCSGAMIRASLILLLMSAATKFFF